ncbi:putative NBD/HSP70 family sugar kinase [Hypnocyclicus thermotrophus]|uniref:NBD/HSP70 family sugar kinase n=1 Tax=Hypnocyclicus thermotrophus TaxID=1627895 RepID=A0AA46I4Y6_9FUSO|nr:ROK family protein [Hypnocyclicus thermotrophus]TDT67937.1 putative NBD/HSP70 family sugar kinase [Hypnocyclicus thermotrophus]
MRYFLTFDVGGTFIKYSLSDENANFLETSKIPTNRDGDKILTDLIKIINKYKKEYTISGLAFSLPGFIDVDKGYSITGGIIKEFYGFEFKKILEEKTGIPVEVENDANCVALAEKWRGHATNSNNFISFTIGTGIGGGIFCNGSLIRGYGFGAGEFGMQINQRKNILYNMTSSTRGGLILEYAERKGLKEEDVSGKLVYELAEKGDKDALEIIEQFYEDITIMIFNLSVVLNPEIIIISGAISAREELFKEINKRLNYITSQNFFLQKIKLPKIIRSKFINDAGKVGALYHFLEMEKNRKKN